MKNTHGKTKENISEDFKVDPSEKKLAQYKQKY
jgi:hypothetical protein